MEHKVYDKAKWHYGSATFPTSLPVENGATHIAFFLRWCIENNFIGKEIANDIPDDITKIKSGIADCRTFLMNYLDGVLTSEDLNTKGRLFANAYYTSTKTKFAKTYGYYCADVDNWAQAQSELVEKGNDDAYFYIENDENTYARFKEIINNRYEEFLQMKKK
ncbi:hypothetical protein VSP20_09150 [Myroides phaeus]|uniref:DUF7832 domain-containing protein n=1 Tax=Myroides phaeus TaxID=702745 RepID=UPI002DBDD6A1|nr:hypothetical protein [Myroides phaeus]MEC4117138.1 hypothetical protein [Myroides phaeus]